MLVVLIRKEIAGAVLDLRFMITALLCMVLIPLGMYVSRKDYERRLDAYQREHQEYRQRYGVGADIYLEAQGLRPPSALSILGSGVDAFVPGKMTTARSGLWRTIAEPSDDNPHSLLFGKADLTFNVVFVLSLAALVLTFDSISGEKEEGTLALMTANSIPRGYILLGKIIGSYAALLIPFSLSLLISLIVLDLSPDVSIGSEEVWPAFPVILGVTLVFLLCMVCLGVCISSLSHRSMSSIVLAFLVWVMLTFVVPKVSPMLAEIIRPVESANVYELARTIAVEDLERALKKETEVIRAKYESEYGAPTDDREIYMWRKTDVGKQSEAKFKTESGDAIHRNEKRLAEELLRIKQDYMSRRDSQIKLGIDLSRISPMCSYTYIVCELCGTGTSASDDFAANAQRYQDQVRQAIYDKIIIRREGWGEGYEYVDDFDLSKAAVPDMRYTYPTVAQALQGTWPDILLLGLFVALFYVVAFLGLNKYDVRAK
jgi:ABC-type transport system involved in multi-copper enzyme maturation permease subunit